MNYQNATENIYDIENKKVALLNANGINDASMSQSD